MPSWGDGSNWRENQREARRAKLRKRYPHLTKPEIEKIVSRMRGRL